MMKRLLPAAALALSLATPAAASFFVDPVDVFQIGNTGGGRVTLSWNHFYDGFGTPTFASLTIVAEGVDEGVDSLGIFRRENDEVRINGTSLGLLDDQNFYYSFFDIHPGPGALGFPQTELSTTVFLLNPALLVAGNNLIEVVLDPGNWIVEIETSRLEVERTPEPPTLFLVGAGLLGLASALRRKR